jgi:hypothetical protein
VATLNALQLASGFGSPILEKTSPPIKYVGTGWILNLREMLDLYNAIVWVDGVTWISELADINGREIPIERIRNGSDWRATPVEG